MKKLALGVLVIGALALAPSVQASEVTTEEIICPQPYGGGVVCGVKTHVPVETGIGDNLLVLGTSFLGASGAFAFLSKKLRKTV